MAEAREEPATKKLRSSEHDLKIVVRDTDEAGNVLAEKEYHVYGVLYAKYSKCIDTSLAVDMREKQTRKIVLNGVQPATFERAIKYLEDLVAARQMRVKDALEVVEFYDMYEFTEGIAICDHVLHDFFRLHRRVTEDYPPDVFDQLVESVAAAYKFRLENANKRGMKIVETTLCRFNPTMAMFTEEHFKLLHPMLTEQEFGRSFLTESMGLSKEEIESPLLPKFLVMNIVYLIIRSAEMIISVSGTAGSEWDIDGKYHWTNDVEAEQRSPIRLFGREANVYFRRGDGHGHPHDWEISASFQDPSFGTLKLWTSPNSRSFPFPPTGPWESHSSELADITPIIQTTMKDTLR